MTSQPDGWFPRPHLPPRRAMILLGCGHVRWIASSGKLVDLWNFSACRHCITSRRIIGVYDWGPAS